MQFTFPSSEPGVPYKVTVRAITAAGLGEPVSVVAFAVQQGTFVPLWIGRHELIIQGALV